MPRRGLANHVDGSPTAKTQRNHRSAVSFAYTDSDNHIMKGNGEMIQGYNSQAMVDGVHQVIVALGVSNQPTDVEHLEPMLERTIANTGACTKTFISDAAYWSEENAEICTDAQTRSQYRHRPSEAWPAASGHERQHYEGFGPQRPNSQQAAHKKSLEVYAKRQTISKPVFGKTKEARSQHRFLLRSLGKANGEWTLWSTTHNILKLFRFQQAQMAMATGKGSIPAAQGAGGRAD